MPIEVFIGIGSNLDEPLQQILKAVKALKKISIDNSVRCSTIYQSKPMGDSEQPDYLNAVACITLPSLSNTNNSVNTSALALLDSLQAIENAHGRIREQHWGSRTLDLDLLVYDNATINEQRLTVPHYGLKQRNFVIIPLAELAPELVLPDGTSINELLNNCSKNGIKAIESS